MGFKLERSFSHVIEVSAQECAALFADLDSNEQAVFFNTLYEITEKWKAGFSMQLQFIADSEVLTNKGRIIMREIGEYAEVYSEPKASGASDEKL